MRAADYRPPAGAAIEDPAGRTPSRIPSTHRGNSRTMTGSTAKDGVARRIHPGDARETWLSCDRGSVEREHSRGEARGVDRRVSGVGCLLDAGSGQGDRQQPGLAEVQAAGQETVTQFQGQVTGDVLQVDLTGDSGSAQPQATRVGIADQAAADKLTDDRSRHPSARRPRTASLPRRPARHRPDRAAHWRLGTRSDAARPECAPYCAHHSPAGRPLKSWHQ
jgi:hypothetical protein